MGSDAIKFGARHGVRPPWGLTPFLLAALIIYLVFIFAANGETLSIGRDADAADIAGLDIDIGPDGAGLPAGSGTARQGEPIYAVKCAGCHGTDGQQGRDRLAGPPGDASHKTVGNYWPYATTIFDYVRRAMPPTTPGSLADVEVYALTAYILHLNSIITLDQEINAESLLRIDMPARDRFVPDNRRGGAEIR